jgi:hypothetical protein
MNDEPIGSLSGFAGRQRQRQTGSQRRVWRRNDFIVGRQIDCQIREPGTKLRYIAKATDAWKARWRC